MSDLKSKILMVVDDSRLSRMLVRGIVEQNDTGWTLIEAEGAEQALQLARAEPVDMALVDLNMPGMDGLELAGQLLDLRPRLRLSLLTANVQQAVRDRAEALGIGFIGKPITEAVIVQFIESEA